MASTIYASKSGKVVTILDVREMIEDYHALFKAAGMTQYGANSLVRLAAYQAAEMFVRVFIPKRFDPEYARNVLGYHASKTYEKWKVENQGTTASWREYRGFVDTDERPTSVAEPQPWPFVLSGEAKMTVLNATKNIAVVEKGGKGYCRITFPLGRIAFRKASTFCKVAAVEYQRFVQEFERNLRLRVLPNAKAGVYPANFQFTASRKGGVQIDERVIINEQRRFG